MNEIHPDMTTKSAVKFKTFLTGMIFGFVVYVIYLQFLTTDDATASAFGWIFFAPQYLVFWAVPEFNLSETVGLVSCYTIITLLYGYIALSFRLSPRTAVGTFTISALGYFFFVHWLDFLFEHMAWLGTLSGILFWPGVNLQYLFKDAGYHYKSVTYAFESLTVGFWYAALICGVRTFFLPIGQPNASDQTVGTSDQGSTTAQSASIHNTDSAFHSTGRYEAGAHEFDAEDVCRKCKCDKAFLIKMLRLKCPERAS